MDHKEFIRQLGKAGLTQVEFANLPCMPPATLSSYRKKERVPDHAAVIASLVGEMADHGLEFRHVFERIGIQRNKPRGMGFDSQSERG